MRPIYVPWGVGLCRRITFHSNNNDRPPCELKNRSQAICMSIYTYTNFPTVDINYGCTLPWVSWLWHLSSASESNAQRDVSVMGVVFPCAWVGGALANRSGRTDSWMNIKKISAINMKISYVALHTVDVLLHCSNYVKKDSTGMTNCMPEGCRYVACGPMK